MKRLVGIPLICLVILVAAIGIAGCASVSPGTKAVPPLPPTTLATGSSGSSSCGITTCHGLDLACGTNAPDVCTMEYRLGDKCRQYARCDTPGGSCSLVTDPKFASCKACVEQCAARASSDGISAFDCEAQC